MLNISEKVTSLIRQKGWSLTETARRAELPLVTLKNVIYNKNSSHRIITLEKLAAALGCRTSDLVSDDSIIVKFDSELFKECLEALESYCSTHNISLEPKREEKIIESLTSFYSRKKAKNLPYIIEEDTIGWILENTN